MKAKEPSDTKSYQRRRWEIFRCALFYRPTTLKPGHKTLDVMGLIAGSRRSAAVGGATAHGPRINRVRTWCIGK